MTKEKKYITTKELARRWLRSPRTIEGWRVRKTGPNYLDLNGKILYELKEIIEFENTSKVTHN
jgi:hypothetical protein